MKAIAKMVLFLLAVFFVAIGIGSILESMHAASNASAGIKYCAKGEIFIDGRSGRGACIQGRWVR